MNKIKKYGEVFTPQFLVDQMLDTLPKEVWSEPNKKWLDPCAGRNGIFPITIYKRLMEGLKEWETNSAKRDAHIWDNMIYMVELQEDAVEELKINIQKTRDEYLSR
jgi:type I restriction-modification system DNA methylase subunit